MTPYADPAKQREACKLNMQKLRAKRKKALEKKGEGET